MGDSGAGDVAPGRPMVEVCELGPLGIRHDGAWASVRGERTSVLLAALSLHRRDGVGSEQLIEAIWPSPDQPPTARQSLANMVSRLRRSFGDDVIESTRTGYRLGEMVSSDRHQFVVDVSTAADIVDADPATALSIVERALKRWRGQPWTGLDRPANVEADRARLIELRGLALRTWGAALLAVGRTGEALPVLREVLSINSVDEDATAWLARALNDVGRRTEALQVIRATNRLLADHGLVAQPALAELERTLLGTDEAPDSERLTDVATPEPDPAQWAPLPSPRTLFLGREHDTRHLRSALDDARIVSILGPGGAGKSRLAIEAASAASPDEPGSVGFVELVSAHSSADVELAFVVGLGLPHDRFEGLSSDDRRHAIASSAGPGLLVVDNCEHVVDDARDLIDRLITLNGGLRIVATSRVPLELPGERRYPLPRFDAAAELLRDRVIACGVPVDAEDPTLDAICELVDHLPLAIELAAAQSPYRTLDELAAELRSGAVHHDPAQPDQRHETMAAAIRWSHRLLPALEYDALPSLGFFVAPFDRADAAAVLGDIPVGDVLDTLVRCSLAERSTDERGSVYRLLVPIQQYAAAELRHRGSTASVALRYADWLLEITDRAFGEVWWHFSVIDELAPRLTNSWAAIDALRRSGRVDDAARLAGRLAGPGHLHGRTTELIEILGQLWPTTNDLDARADALVGLVFCGDAASRNDVLGHALGELDALQMPGTMHHRIVALQMNAIWVMWAELLTDAPFDASADLLARARSLALELDSPLTLGWVEYFQSCLHLFEGDWPAAENAAHRSRDVAPGTLTDLLATTCLAFAHLHRGDLDGALAAADHPERDRFTVSGDVIGIVSALAYVESGEVEAGLSALETIRRRANSTHIPRHVDNAAIAVAHAAHLLGDDDITLDVLATGVRGMGVHIGHLVPHLCRELDIPLTGRYVTDAERIRRSRRIASMAESSLDTLRIRHAK